MIKENNLFSRLSKEVQKEFLNQNHTYATKELRNALEEETHSSYLQLRHASFLFWVVYPKKQFDALVYTKLFKDIKK